MVRGTCTAPSARDQLRHRVDESKDRSDDAVSLADSADPLVGDGAGLDRYLQISSSSEDTTTFSKAPDAKAAFTLYTSKGTPFMGLIFFWDSLAAAPR